MIIILRYHEKVCFIASEAALNWPDWTFIRETHSFAWNDTDGLDLETEKKRNEISLTQINLYSHSSSIILYCFVELKR